MLGNIEPTSLPPHLAYFEMCLATWNEAVMAAMDEAFHWYCLPFKAPHHHPAMFRYQMELPEPIEESGEHDIFA